MKIFSSLSLLFILAGCLTQNPIIELAPDAPTSLTVSPVSPSNDTTPTVKGQSSSSASVVLFSGPDCSGAPLATGQAGTNGQFSLTSGELPTGVYNFSVRASSARGTICSSTSVTYSLTATPPVASVTKASSTALINSTDTVSFIVEYIDADEVNLTEADILISDTGTVVCADITITNETTATPHVTIGNCTGDGTFGITIGAGTATNLAGTSLASNMSSTVTVDNTGISTATFNPAAGTYITLPPSIEITFPEAYYGLDGSDFAVDGTCSIKPNITVTPDRTSLTGTISLTEPTCAAGETVEITLDFTGIEDGAGNPGTTQLISTYTIDDIGPTSATFNPGTSNINTIPETINVTFSEVIDPDSLSASSFIVTGNCAPLPEVADLVTVSGATAQITLIGGTCTNTQTFDVAIDLSTVLDSLGSAGSGPANATYTFDDVGPVVSSITPVSGPTGSAPTSVTVNFDEEVLIASVAGSDLKVSGTCGAGVTAGVTTETSGNSIEFELFGVSCTDGKTLIVTLDGADITDSAGNQGTATKTETYTVDTTGPSVLSISPATGTVNSVPTSIVFSFSENLKSATVGIDDFELGGSCIFRPSISLVTLSGNEVTVNLSGAACNQTETLTLTVTNTGITDIYNNPGVGSEPVTYILDTTGPVAGAFTLGSHVAPSPSRISFNEDIKPDSVATSDFDTTGSTCDSPLIQSATAIGAEVIFQFVATCDQGETVNISIDGANVTDLADNNGSGTYSVIYTAP